VSECAIINVTKGKNLEYFVDGRVHINLGETRMLALNMSCQLSDHPIRGCLILAMCKVLLKFIKKQWWRWSEGSGPPSSDLRHLCNSCKSDEFFSGGGRGRYTSQAGKFKLLSSG